jgi:hypothetical protein
MTETNELIFEMIGYRESLCELITCYDESNDRLEIACLKLEIQSLNEKILELLQSVFSQKDQCI